MGCIYRSRIKNHNDELIGYLCACPAGRHDIGYDCIDDESCSIAQKQKRDFTKAEKLWAKLSRSARQNAKAV